MGGGAAAEGPPSVLAELHIDFAGAELRGVGQWVSAWRFAQQNT